MEAREKREIKRNSQAKASDRKAQGTMILTPKRKEGEQPFPMLIDLTRETVNENLPKTT